MRILVVEDKELHRASARETLTGHEVTIVDSFKAAMRLLSDEVDQEKFERLKQEDGFPKKPDRETSTAEEREAYLLAESEAWEKSHLPCPFDAVLTDMMLPMSEETVYPEAFNPYEQVPYGFVIALRAAAVGAKYVAMASDTNHHASAISAAIDYLQHPRLHRFRTKFVINGAKVAFVHAPFMEDRKSKDWGHVLRDLTAD